MPSVGALCLGGKGGLALQIFRRERKVEVHYMKSILKKSVHSVARYSEPFTGLFNFYSLESRYQKRG
jgi:hypothetical protein